MKVSEKFASNFLKAEDLQGRKSHVIIASIGEDEIGGEKHLVVYFRSKQKALILNKTNASYLAEAISDETDDWPGHEIILYPTKVNFQGKMVDAIRIEMPSQAGALKQQPHANGGAANAYAAASQPGAVPQSAPDISSSAALDDEIPF